MAKKQSFADKSSKKGKSLGSFVKYVKSILSEKSGHWRFNEQIVNIKDGENLDSALKRINEDFMDTFSLLPIYCGLCSNLYPAIL